MKKLSDHNIGRLRKALARRPKKAVSVLSRPSLIKWVRSFRDAWEELTTRNQDLPDCFLLDASVGELRGLLRWFLSDKAADSANEWLASRSKKKR